MMCNDEEMKAFWDKMDEELSSFVQELWRPLLEDREGPQESSENLDTFEEDEIEESTTAYFSFPKGTPEHVLKSIVGFMAKSGMRCTISVEGWDN